LRLLFSAGHARFLRRDFHMRLTIRTTLSGMLLAAATLFFSAPGQSRTLEANDRHPGVALSQPVNQNELHLKVAQLKEGPATAEAPSHSFRDCPNCPEMVEIPAGRFTMGDANGDTDEKPAHEVVLAKPFAVGKFEITFIEWEACASDGGCAANKRPGDEEWGRGKRPVVNVSWYDAKEYLAWLSAKTGKHYRLLSEAEWEYAARAGTTTKYAFGDTIDKKQARFSDGKPGIGQTVEVGSFAPNAWGLYDMHGNVWEWVEDCYGPGYGEAPADGSARTGAGCGPRVLRGGSWDYVAQDLRSSIRYRLPPIYRVDEVGFRVAREL
jgi:formylglycine-generating enzyme required for sulfatase activity